MKTKWNATSNIQPCKYCNGYGYNYSKFTMCYSCNGTGFSTEKPVNLMIVEISHDYKTVTISNNFSSAIYYSNSSISLQNHSIIDTSDTNEFPEKIQLSNFEWYLKRRQIRTKNPQIIEKKNYLKMKQEEVTIYLNNSIKAKSLDHLYPSTIDFSNTYKKEYLSNKKLNLEETELNELNE
jgi:recombinational DNA repair protein RecR